MRIQRFFHPDYAPVYVPALLSLAGTLFYLYGARDALLEILSQRWSVHYLLATPFIHAGWGHFLLNMMVLHYIGGTMLLPLVGKYRFVILLASGAIAGNVVNNLFAPVPAIGLSSALTALLGCAIYPYGKAPMKLLLIHDILRLPPFPFRYIVAFVALVDVCGIVFGWGFFAHWAHLGGLASGLIAGYVRFRRAPF